MAKRQIQFFKKCDLCRAKHSITTRAEKNEVKQNTSVACLNCGSDMLVTLAQDFDMTYIPPFMGHIEKETPEQYAERKRKR